MKRLLLVLMLLMLPLCARAESLSLSVKGNIQGYTENTITAKAGAAGTLTLTVSDDYGVYRVWDVEVEEGENKILWDGTGWNGERIPDGKYTLSGALTTADGAVVTDETGVTFVKCKNVLMFALPSSDTLYLSGARWFVELRLIRSGDTVVAEFYRADDPENCLGTQRNKISGAGVVEFGWNGKLDKKAVEPGDYLIRFYAASNPAYVREVNVTVESGKSPSYEIEVSPTIMPEHGMSDEEIWAIMQQPSVVADLTKQTNHLTIRSGKGSGKELGTVHGQSQGMQVLEIDGSYVKVGAWVHEDGSYVEGWVKKSDLKVVTPNDEYGILVNKIDQTMTVFYRGEAIDTFEISTGLAAPNRLIRETPAGAFLTVDRISYFNDGYQYDYVIRYDGGNLIHQMGYKKAGAKKDFSDQVVDMGTKASHGCIRVSNVPSEQGINAYWLYTHLPYHTRLIILDDPEQRALQAKAAGADPGIENVQPIAPPELKEGEFELVLTVGGDAVLGTRESWWDRDDAFPHFIEEYGMAYPFSGLQDVFANDDMTFVNLEGVLKADKSGESKSKEFRFRGLPEWAEILTLSSIEQVSIANNHYIDYGMEGRDATRQALTDEGIPFSGFEFVHIWEQSGVKIGFGGCRETVYESNRMVVYRDIRAMKDAGCDLIIYTCHWGKEYATQHNELQERIAADAAAAGADIVIGGHPHVVQGVDSVGDVPVLYSLGNLMFGGTLNLQTYDGMLAKFRLRFDAEGYVGCTVSLIPVLTSGQAAEDVNDYRPVVAEGDDKARILEKVQFDTEFELMDEMYFPADR